MTFPFGRASCEGRPRCRRPFRPERKVNGAAENFCRAVAMLQAGRWVDDQRVVCLNNNIYIYIHIYRYDWNYIHIYTYIYIYTYYIYMLQFYNSSFTVNSQQHWLLAFNLLCLGVVYCFLPNSRKLNTQQPWNLLLGCKMLAIWVEAGQQRIILAIWGCAGLQICLSFFS